MVSPRRVLLHSLDSTIAPEASQSRRDYICRIDNPARRAGALLIHDFTVSHPHAVARSFGLDYRIPRLAYVGSGGTANVFRLNNDEVLKVDRMSLLMKPATLERCRMFKLSLHEQLASALGSFVLPLTGGFIAPHPVFTNRNSIQTSQSYCEIEDLDLFTDATVEEIAGRIDTLEARRPGTVAELHEFTERSLGFYRATGLLPDTAGSNNIGLAVSTDELMIRDGQPIGSDAPIIQKAIIGHFDRLATALAIAA